MKTCVRCGIEKPLGEFGIRKDRKNAALGHCKRCDADGQKNNPGRIRAWKLLSKYKVTPIWYLAQLQHQNGKCAICKLPSTKPFHVDHDHETGKARAIVCFGCNLLVGSDKTQIVKLQAAVNYLRDWS